MMAQQNQNNDDLKQRKIFVGNLAWRTTTNDLRMYCENFFGAVVDANVVTYHTGVTTRSKGYGFVVFRDTEAASRACQKPHPVIDGRQTNINLSYINQNASSSNQAGPSHQFQNGIVGSTHQAGASHQHQSGSLNPYVGYQQFIAPYPSFWDSNTGRHNYMYVHPFLHYQPQHLPTMFRYPTYGTQPSFPHAPQNITETNQQVVDADDVVHIEEVVDAADVDDDNNEEVAADVDNEEEAVTEPRDSDVDQENSEDQQVVDIKPNAEDQQASENVSGEDIKEDIDEMNQLRIEIKESTDI